MKFFSLLILLLTISCGKVHLFEPLTNKEPQKITFGAESGYLSWPNSRIQFDIKFKADPQVAVDSPFEIQFWDAYETDSEGPYKYFDETLCVFLWMKMPSGSEHGSSPVEITKENNTYSVKDVYFIMPGTWKIYIRTLNSGESCTKESSFKEQSIVEITL